MAKLIFPSSEEAQKASRLAAKGKLHRIRKGIYIDTDDTEEITNTLNNKWMEVACKIFDVIKMKNMYGKQHLGIERSTFLIDSKGILRQEWRKIRVKGHVDAVLELVKAL